MFKQTIKAALVVLAVAFAAQAAPAQAASTSPCNYLQNTQCSGPVTILDWLLASLAY